MKKVLFTSICLALVATACNKESALVPDMINDNVRTVSLSATLPQTKVNVDGTTGKVTWSIDDAIAVYNTDNEKFKFTLKTGAGDDNATFECTSFTGTIGDIAIYPYSWASDTPGNILIPTYIERSDAIPAVMASKINGGDGSEISPLYFKSLMPIVKFTLKDVPAYACALKLWSKNGEQLSGTYSVNSDCSALENVPTGNTQQVIYFPYKTAYGTDATVDIYAAIPAFEYTDLYIRVLDGDEDVIEGTGKKIPQSSVTSKLTPDAYVTMPELNVRSMVGTARDKYIKVEGVKWAKGNLRAWKSGTSGEGWQSGWNIYDNQWESQYMLLNDEVTGDSKNFTLNSSLYKEENVYTHWDYFSWGTLARASRVHNTVITSNVAEFSICGKIFSGQSGDISSMPELEGDERFADTGGFNSNPSICGDLAFWASKGQYRMPTKTEFTSLYSKDVHTNNRANMQAGYYMVGTKRINGILFTSCPSWIENNTYQTTSIEFSTADIESGLFLPKIGERSRNDGTNYDATNIVSFNAWGVYWCGYYGARGEGLEDCARYIDFVGSNTMTYGYSHKLSNTQSGQTKLGNAIRPVLVK